MLVVRVIVVATVSVVLLSGCGGAKVDTSLALAQKLGCSSTYTFDQGSDPETGLREVGVCYVDGQEVRLMMFVTDFARDAFEELATTFRGTRFIKGDGYLIPVEESEMENALKEALNGGEPVRASLHEAYSEEVKASFREEFIMGRGEPYTTAAECILDYAEAHWDELDFQMYRVTGGQAVEDAVNACKP